MQVASTPCDSCGAPVSFVLGAAELRCERCGARRALEAGLAETLAAAMADHATAVAAELRARWVAAFYANNERAQKLVVSSVVVLAPLVLLWWFLLAVDAAPSVVSSLLLALVSVAAVGAFGRGLRIMHEMPSLRALALVETLRCAGCGAWSGFAASRPADRCAYCSATRLVPLTLVRASIDLVRGATVDPVAHAPGPDDERRRDGRFAGLAIATPFVIVIVVVPGWVALELTLLHGVPRLSVWWGLALLGAFALIDTLRTVTALRGAMARREQLEREISQQILAVARAD